MTKYIFLVVINTCGIDMGINVFGGDMPPGPNGDGNLYVGFFPVGLGDCIFFTFPDGKRLLIDFGSKRKDIVDPSNIVEELYGDPYLLNANRLNALILTHAHPDHFSWIQSFLTRSTSQNDFLLPVDRIIFGGHAMNFNSYNDAPFLKRNYPTNSIVNYDFSDDDPKAKPKMVTVEDYVKSTKEPFGYRDVPAESITADGAVQILQGAKQGASYSVAILTSNPPICSQAEIAPYNDSNLRSVDDTMAVNTSSVVTLITLNKAARVYKMLITGDATIYSEKYLIDRYGAAIANLHLLKVGHHGSESSSSLKFVRHTAPERVIISAAKDDDNNCLPRKVVFDKWLTSDPRLEDLPAAHTSYVWDKATKQDINEAKQKLATAAEDDDVPLFRACQKWTWLRKEVNASKYIYVTGSAENYCELTY